MSVDILLSPKYAAGLRVLVIPKYGKINLADNVVFTPPVAATGGLTGVRYPGNFAGVVLGSSVSQAASEDFTCAFLIDTPNPGTSNGGVFRTSTGADNFVILASTSGQSYPWIRLAGSNVLQPSNGPKTPSYRPFLGVVSVRSGKSVEFALDGVVVHRATTAVNTGAGSFSTLGMQNGENCGAFSAIAYFSRYIDPVALSRDIMLPQHSGTQFLFGVSAGGEPSASLTGGAGTASAGNAAPSISASISGVSATSAVGSVSPSTGATASITGTASTASVGSLSPEVSRALAGSQASTASGTTTAGLAKALTGSAATTSSGTLSPTVGATATLSGTASTTAAGTTTVGLAIPLTGSAATTSTGTLSPTTGATAALSGAASTTATGALAATLSITLGGTSATTSAGTLSLPGSYSAALSASQTTSSAGTVSPSISKAIAGVQSTTAVGTPSATTGATASLSGVQASSATGALSKSVAIAISGCQSTTFAGALGKIAQVSGQGATTSVGTLNASTEPFVAIEVMATRTLFVKPKRSTDVTVREKQKSVTVMWS